MAHSAAADSVSTPRAHFPEVALVAPLRTSHRWAIATMGAGVALVGSSFLFDDRADSAYDAYLRETDPDQIERWYGRAVLRDRLSSGSLLAGEALLAFGIYLRFIRPPLPPRMGFLVAPPGRCAVSLRF